MANLMHLQTISLFQEVLLFGRKYQNGFTSILQLKYYGLFGS